MVFEGMDINQNKAMYSEFLFILNLDVSTVETEFIGLFTYSIPFKSRKYSNVDLKLDHFLFPDLTRINTNALSLDKFYSVSILPRVYHGDKNLMAYAKSIGTIRDINLMELFLILAQE